MGKDDLTEKCGEEKNNDKNLAIFFEINNSYIRGNTNHFKVSLIFKSSNYDLNKDEIIRASVRPNHLLLDNDVDYVKTNEKSYLNKNGQNMLQINYCKLNRG